jgi:hypothetical protein
MTRKILIRVALFSLFAWLAGCTKEPSPSGEAPKTSPTVAEGAKYLLSAEPAGAKDVTKLREEAKDGDAVVIVGRVGGSREPCVKGRVAFTIVDMAQKSCDENGEDCQTPWDYCHLSTSEIAAVSAMIKIVDEQGKTVPHDVKEFLGIQPLQTVVVQGKVKRDNGNLTVLADGIYIRPKPR